MRLNIELENINPTKEWFNGLIDLHLYNRPCVFRRQFTTVELAKQCYNAGYRAIVIKNHFYPTVEGAYIASQEVPGIDVYGGIVLNWPVGGINPFATYTAIEMGAKVIWLGNMHSGTLSKDPFRTEYGWGSMADPNSSWVKGPTKRWMIRTPTNTIDLETGELLPEVLDIIDLIAEADIILATCHISKKECFAVVPAAIKAGVKKIVITHPNVMPGENPDRDWTIDDFKKITAMGAILEHVATSFKDPTSPTWPMLVKVINSVGAENCELASDSGNLGSVHPIEAMRHFIFNLRYRGISEKDIEIMTKKNPAKLLGLE